MKKSMVFFGMVLIAVSIMTGCQEDQTFTGHGEVVANINGEKYTDEKLDMMIKVLPPQAAAQFQGEDGHAKMLEQLSTQKLLVQHAKELGLDKEPMYLVKREMVSDEILMELFYRQFTAENPADDVTLKAFLKEHPDALGAEETFSAKHILVSAKKDQKVFNSTNSDAVNEEEAQKKLKMIQDKLTQGESFEDLAKKYSEGPSAPRGGDLGSFKSGAMVPEFEEGLKNLKPGEVSDVVKSRFGYHIIQLVSHNMGETKAYEDLDPQAKQTLNQQYYRTLLSDKIEELKKKAVIEIKK